jgi:hypothetical protein
MENAFKTIEHNPNMKCYMGLDVEDKNGVISAILNLREDKNPCPCKIVQSGLVLARTIRYAFLSYSHLT